VFTSWEEVREAANRMTRTNINAGGARGNDNSNYVLYHLAGRADGWVVD